MIYAVPLVISGGALYSARDAINHVIHALKSDGFNVAYLGENLIYISWEVQEPKKYKVRDYVAAATSGNPSSQTAVSKVHGPGNPRLVTAGPQQYQKYLNSQIAARSKEYEDASAAGSIRLSFNNHTTHESALRGATRSHGRI